MYKCVFKRLLDIVIASAAIAILAIPMLLITIAIKSDDPGPALFKQKRVGKKKNGQITYFMMWKFRSMKMSTPHDMPTHLLCNPEQYVTRVGRVIRKASLDELPQFINILLGDMSFVGPRPALWNQDDLLEARERYGANDVLPGLTGWAQVNGRDELDLLTKAKFDGDYAAALNKGRMKGLFMDIRCFFKTISCVVTSKGFAEGSAQR